MVKLQIISILIFLVLNCSRRHDMAMFSPDNGVGETEEAVLLFGTDGEDKKTIMNYLLGNEGNNHDIEALNDDITFDSPLNKLNSELQHKILPHPYFIDEKNSKLRYYSSPDFFDIRNYESSIYSQIYHNFVFQKCKKIGAICCITSIGELKDEKACRFLDDIKKVISSLLNTTDTFDPLESIFLVLCNTRDDDNVGFSKKVLNLLKISYQKYSKLKRINFANLQKYDQYLKILSKIVNDGINPDSTRIMCINPLDKGISRKIFIDRVLQSSTIPNENLNELFFNQFDSNLQYLQERIINKTQSLIEEAILNKEKIAQQENIVLGIEKLVSEKYDSIKNIIDLSADIKDVKKKISNLKLAKDLYKIKTEYVTKEIKLFDTNYTPLSDSQSVNYVYDGMIYKLENMIKAQNKIKSQLKNDAYIILRNIDHLLIKKSEAFLNNDIDHQIKNLEVQKQRKRVNEIEKQKESFQNDLDLKSAKISEIKCKIEGFNKILQIFINKRNMHTNQLLESNSKTHKKLTTHNSCLSKEHNLVQNQINILSDQLQTFEKKVQDEKDKLKNHNHSINMELQKLDEIEKIKSLLKCNINNLNNMQESVDLIIKIEKINSLGLITKEFINQFNIYKNLNI